MLRGMGGQALALVRRLADGPWGLHRARATARVVEISTAAVRALVTVMFDEDAGLRVRAADVARRITERSAEPLFGYADELAGLLASSDPEQRRTRWHLGLVVARVAHTREQRLRAARLMELLAGEEGEVRCSAIEGIGVLARAESSLREIAAEMVDAALRDGTKAQRCRAVAVRKVLGVAEG